MYINSSKVYQVLRGNGVTRIHHANSVMTACQFLRHGALMSRGTIERRGLFQTPQSSDKTDKRHSLWFDVFVDSVDIHARARQMNFYGPVLLVFDSALIKQEYTGAIWVTRLNPTKWHLKSREERWFSSHEDLEDGFLRGGFDQMIVFRHCGGEVPMGYYLKRIILDDPQLKTSDEGVDFFSMAYGALQLAMTEGGIEVPIQRRNCATGCKCKSQYRSRIAKTKALFFPKDTTAK